MATMVAWNVASQRVNALFDGWQLSVAFSFTSSQPEMEVEGSPFIQCTEPPPANPQGFWSFTVEGHDESPTFSIHVRRKSTKSSVYSWECKWQAAGRVAVNHAKEHRDGGHVSPYPYTCFVTAVDGKTWFSLEQVQGNSPIPDAWGTGVNTEYSRQVYLYRTMRNGEPAIGHVIDTNDSPHHNAQGQTVTSELKADNLFPANQKVISTKWEIDNTVYSNCIYDHLYDVLASKAAALTVQTGEEHEVDMDGWIGAPPIEQGTYSFGFEIVRNGDAGNGIRCS